MTLPPAIVLRLMHGLPHAIGDTLRPFVVRRLCCRLSFVWVRDAAMAALQHTGWKAYRFREYRHLSFVKESKSRNR